MKTPELHTDVEGHSLHAVVSWPRITLHCDNCNSVAVTWRGEYAEGKESSGMLWLCDECARHSNVVSKTRLRPANDQADR